MQHGIAMTIKLGTLDGVFWSLLCLKMHEYYFN